MEYRMEIEVESGNTSINEVEETQLFEEIQEIMNHAVPYFVRRPLLKNPNLTHTQQAPIRAALPGGIK